MTTESKQSAMDIEEKQSVSFHEEGEIHDTSKTGYTGDHVTGTSHSSPVERSLLWKIGPLFVTMASLVYFVSYLVSIFDLPEIVWPRSPTIPS